MYAIYLHENVTTTPFYQLVLDLLKKPKNLHPSERKLLTDFLKSVPKVGKQTPNEYVQESDKDEDGKYCKDLYPYYKAHAEHMPHTNLLCHSEVESIIRDGQMLFPESTKYLGYIELGKF